MKKLILLVDIFMQHNMLRLHLNTKNIINFIVLTNIYDNKLLKLIEIDDLVQKYSQGKLSHSELKRR